MQERRWCNTRVAFAGIVPAAGGHFGVGVGGLGPKVAPNDACFQVCFIQAGRVVASVAYGSSPVAPNPDPAISHIPS